LKILHLDKNHPLLVEKLTAAGFQNDEDYESSKAEIERVVHNYQGIVIRSRFKIDTQFLDAAENLKFIARVGAGLESINVPYAESNGVLLISASEGNRNAVGEHTLGMLLALLNKMILTDREVKFGKWNREASRGIELDGKTVGLIGYGNTGKAFAKKLRGFDCEVICYDIKANVGDENAIQVSLETLQNKTDVLSLHTPWTPLTDKMIDAQFIAQFDKPFWLLNTARGKSVVTSHLVSALKNGKILGAGLDVLEYENLSFESLFTSQLMDSLTDRNDMPPALEELLKMDNVILSPHVAGWTVESRIKLAQTTFDKITAEFS
jgi:D-3-phosphoglycerate dehydrogenase / 2-oxoglutarate reductase